MAARGSGQPADGLSGADGALGWRADDGGIGNADRATDQYVPERVHGAGALAVFGQ